MNDLGRCIILSGQCEAAFNAGDTNLARRLMRERDALCVKLSNDDAGVHRRWADRNMTTGDVDRIDTNEDA